MLKVQYASLAHGELYGRSQNEPARSRQCYLRGGNVVTFVAVQAMPPKRPLIDNDNVGPINRIAVSLVLLIFMSSR